MNNKPLSLNNTAVFNVNNAEKKEWSREEKIRKQSQSHLPKMRNRCDYWPACTNKNCKFAHPTAPCRVGDECQFVTQLVYQSEIQLVSQSEVQQQDLLNVLRPRMKTLAIIIVTVLWYLKNNLCTYIYIKKKDKYPTFPYYIINCLCKIIKFFFI
ncbi:hypothetical protein EDC94DRAFT_129508 [Helicostylum pulchrum]|nr:hypothetical protein EDC94DRAFT_129508 [Helicostylum pulchrum]